MVCHVCDAPAIGQCQVCWRFYCREHGEIICEPCNEKSPDWQASPGQSDAVLSHTLSVSGPDEPPPTPEQLQEMMKQMGLVRKTILRRVVPVVQTQTVGDTQITLVSLDIYEECFVANVRMRMLERDRDPARGPFQGMPDLDWHVSDNTGREYSTTFGGGGGNSDEFRWEVTVAPAIADDVHQLDFVINQLEWRALPFMPNLGPKKKIEPGPWRFEVALT
jgi:hypothetical protein